MKSHLLVLLTTALHFGAYAQDLSNEIRAATVYRSEAYIERGVLLEPGSSMVLPFSYSVRYPKNSFINLPR
jgi:hypothetical protein